MPRRVTPYQQSTARERLGRTLAVLPEPAVRALQVVAERSDLPLAAGTWQDGGAGCLVANVVAAHAGSGAAGPGGGDTLDLRVLQLIPELSSRDLNRLIVAWDEAAEDLEGDEALRGLLRGALVEAGCATHDAQAAPPARGGASGACAPWGARG